MLGTKYIFHEFSKLKYFFSITNDPSLSKVQINIGTEASSNSPKPWVPGPVRTQGFYEVSQITEAHQPDVSLFLGKRST